MNFKYTSDWKVIAAAVAVGALALAAGWLWLSRGPGQDVVIDIPMHSGSAGIGKRLQAAGVIRSVLAFRIFAVTSGQAQKLKAGEYAFPAGCTLPEVMRRLAEGRTLQHRFTVPEGFTARQIAKKLSAEGLAQADEFLALVQNPHIAKEWRLPASSLEGFLFPDTYDLTKGMDAKHIAQRMVERFREKVNPELLQAGRHKGLNELGVVTLASIIEKEVRVPEERARVASVFSNRLEKKMRLESCATVLYSLGRSGGALSLEDLNSASPYNTYRHRGLPPGPICNPGLSSLEAAGHPDATDYIFFVVRPDGQHVFSKDFEAHKRAKWIQKRARRAQDKVPGL